MGTKFVWDDEKIPEMDNGNGRTMIRLYVMPLNCIHQHVIKMVAFMLYLFYHNKNTVKYVTLTLIQ